MWRVLLRDGVRTLRRDLRGTLLAVALLGITIGAITAIYAIVHAVVLRPFGFKDQDRLAVIWQRDDRRALPIIEVSYGNMQDWAARSRVLDGLAVIGSVNWGVTLGGASPQTVPMAGVSASFFRVMGVAPFLGRPLIDDDEKAAQPGVAVISHGLWVRRFSSDASIVGRTVPTLDGAGAIVPIEIVGVMPGDFDFPRGVDVWIPAAPIIRQSAGSFGGSADNALRFLNVFYAVGRLREGVSVTDATADLTQVMRTADRAGGPEPPQSLLVTPVATYLLGPAGPVLRTLLAGSALMLLIACANVAGLQVARAAARHRALAVRVALGASGRQLVAQILMESTLCTLCALAVGLALAEAMMRALVWLAPAEVPRLDSATLVSAPVLGIGGLAAFLTAVLCAVWPVLATRRLDAVSVLAHGRDAGTPRGRLVQRAIVISQLAIALMLLAGTALFVRTVRGLDRTTLGFEANRLLAFGLSPQTNDKARWNAVYDSVIDRLTALPQIAGAAGALNRPLNGPIGWDNQPIYPGQVPSDPNTWGLNPHINLEVVTPGYFKMMGIRLVRGRWFTAADTTAAPGVVVVGESMARRMWPGRDAIGQRMFEPTYRNAESDRPKGVWQTVIGVVEDVRYRGLNDVRLDVYLPATQSRNVPQVLMVRAAADGTNVMATLRDVVRRIDPAAEVSEGTSMPSVVDAESAPWRFLVRVFVAFAALAATLAAVGLAAVIALTVTARRRELAIRAALGADGARLRGLVLREAVGLVVLGLAGGLVGAFTLGQTVAHVLINVAPHDAYALGAATVIAAVTGLVACWLPSRRAADADPLEAMRAE